MIEDQLTVANWRMRATALMRLLLGGRNYGKQETMIAALMAATVRTSSKTWSRSLAQYDTLDVEAEITVRRGPVQMLDIGCGDASVLGLLKKRFPDKLIATGVTVTEHPHPEDVRCCICPAEVLPIDWADRFYLVVTHQAFRYMLYPQMALGEALRVLAPDGIFAGYIGIIEDEERVFYNANLPGDLRDCISQEYAKRLQSYDINALELLSRTPHECSITVLRRGSTERVHSVQLRKNGRGKTGICRVDE